MAVSAGTIGVTIDATGAAKFSMAMQKAAADVGSLQKSLGRLGDVVNAAGTAMAGFLSLGLAKHLAKGAEEAGKAIRVFESLGGSMDHLRKATMGMISDAELAKRANLAETMGIKPKDFEDMARIAKAAAAKTGQDVNQMFDSIVVGTARQSKMILDNLGIMVNVEQANQAYARSNKLVASSLTDVQKQAAFTEAVLLGGNKILRDLERSGVPLVSRFSQFSAAVENLGNAFGSVLLPAVNAALGGITPMVDSITHSLKSMRTLWDENWEEMADSVYEMFGDVKTNVNAGARTVLLGFMTLGQGLLKVISMAVQDVINILFQIPRGWLLIGKLLIDGGNTVFNTIVDAALAVPLAITMAMDAVAKLAGKTTSFADEVRAANASFKEMTTGNLAKVGDKFSEWEQDLKDVSDTAREFVGYDLMSEADMERDINKLFEDATIDVGFRATPKAKKDATDLGNTLGDAAAEKLKKLAAQRQAFGEFIGGMRREEQAGASAFPDLTHAVQSYEATMLKASEIGQQNSDKAGEVQDLAQRAMIRSINKQLEGADSLQEFNRMSADAADKLNKLGISTASLQTELDPKNLADVFKEPISKLADSLGAAFFVDKKNKDKLVDKVSTSLADLFEGGKLDFSKISAGIGQLLGGMGPALGKMIPALAPALGAVGGPKGAMIGAAAGGALASIAPQIADALQKVADQIVSTAMKLPEMVSEGINKLSNMFVSDPRAKEAISAAFNPIIGQAGIVAVALGALAPLVFAAAAALATYAITVETAMAHVMIPLRFMESVVLSLVAIIAYVFAPVVIAVTAAVATWAAVVVAATAGITAFVGGLTYAFKTIQGSKGFKALTETFDQFSNPTAFEDSALFKAFEKTVLDNLNVFAMLNRAIENTESFKAFNRAIDASTARLTKAVEPFFENLMALAGLFDALISVVIPLFSAFAQNEVIARALFNALKFAALGVAYAALVLGIFANTVLAVVIVTANAFANVADAAAILEHGFKTANDGMLIGAARFIEGIVNAIPGLSQGIRDQLTGATNALLGAVTGGGAQRLGDDLRAIAGNAENASPDLEAMRQAIRELTGLTYEEATTRAQILAREKAMSEELTNIPAGFKVAAARFRAIATENLTAGVSAGNVLAGEASAGLQFIGATINVTANNVEEFSEQLRAEAERASFQQNGTAGIGGISPPGLPGFG